MTDFVRLKFSSRNRVTELTICKAKSVSSIPTMRRFYYRRARAIPKRGHTLPFMTTSMANWHHTTWSALHVVQSGRTHGE